MHIHTQVFSPARRSGLTLLIGASLAAASMSACGSDTSDPQQSGAEGPRGASASTPTLPTIRVTGIPDENPTKLSRAYAPLVALLEQKLGTKVVYVPVTDYGAAVQALIGGTVDFAWLGGFTHVLARNNAQVEPLAMREIDREFKSVFIANVRAKIASPADLRGKTFSFGSKSSTSGHLMPRYFLSSRYSIDPDKDFKGRPMFSKAHDATAKLVEAGRVDAGALNAQVWQRMVRQKQVDTSRVRVIWTTPGYVDYVWTARTAVPAAIRQRFKRALLELDASNPAHKEILELVGARRYVSAAASDFDAIERVARSVGLLK